MQYALELYLPRLGSELALEAVARDAAAAMRRRGTHVRFVRSIFMPRDEICFLLFDAPSGEAVAETADRAAIAFERVVEVGVLPKGATP